MNLYSKLKHYFSPKPMICFRCKEDKKPSEFHRDSSTNSGRAASCRECKNKKRVKIEIEEVGYPAAIHEHNGFIPEIWKQDVEAFGRVCEALMKKFDRSIMIRIEKDLKTELRVYGIEHKEQFRGKKPEDVVDMILG